MIENDRIESIKKNGGRHLQNFKRQNITYAMCITAVSNDGTALCFVPKDMLTAELCAIACSSNGLSLRFVPEELKSEPLCLQAALNNPEAIKDTPNDYINIDFIDKVLQKHGLEAISQLPKEFRTTEFYSKLIDKNPRLLWHMPKKYRSIDTSKETIKALGHQELISVVKEDPSIMGVVHDSMYDHESCLEFVKSNYFQNAVRITPGRGMLGSISDSGVITLNNYSFNLKKILKWDDVCKVAVQHCGYLLRFVPVRLIDEELSFLAIRASGGAFEYVPKHLRTKKLCEQAVDIDPWNIERVPEDSITTEMCLKAVKESGFLLRSVPDELKTPEMCKIAVSNQGEGVDYVPENLFDKELALLAITQSPPSAWHILHKIPKRLRDHDVCLAAVKRSGEDLEAVPDAEKDYEICLIAAQKSGRSAQYIPHGLFTPEICLALLKNSATAFDAIPKDCLTEEACFEAIKHGSRYGGTIIGKIPRHLISQEMCNLAIKESVFSLQDIPDEYVTEEILMYVAQEAPGRLLDNFPTRFQTEEFINRMIEKYPVSERYIKEIVK